MGLRRTPPPGMDATPSRPVDFPSEFPAEFPDGYPELTTELPPPSSPPAPPSPSPLPSIAAKIPSPKPPSPTHLSPKLLSPRPLSPKPSPRSSPRSPSLKPPSPKLPSPKQPIFGLPSPARPRVTPRNSIFPGEDSDNLTPHTGLIGLARVVNRPPATPQRPTTSGGGAASIRRSIRRTPGAGRLNPLTARSPHANRAFEVRRVERRKSGRYPTARETPRDLLRALSRQLAPTTLPYEPTPNPTPAHAHRGASANRERRASDVMFYSDPGHTSNEEDDDTNWHPPAPRLSMNLNDLDQSYDDDDLRAMRFSVPLDDLDNTRQSIEFARRAASEPRRDSYGSDRFADFQTATRSDFGDETVGEISMMLGEDSTTGNFGGEDGEEEMELLDAEEGDVTRGTELELEGDESLFLGNVDDVDDVDSGDDSDPMPETDYAPNSDNDGDNFDDNNNDAEPSFDPSAEPSARDIARSRIGAGFEIKPLPPKIKPPRRKAAIKKVLPLSRHGHPVPQFPRGVIKKMAQNFGGGAKISNETLNAIVAASEAFFEQVSEDLAVYAGHAGRKTIEDADMVQLLKRQRLITPQNTVFSLAQRHLPRELLQEVRMPVQKPERSKRVKPARVEVEVEGGGSGVWAGL